MNSGADRLIKRLGKAAAKGQEVNIWRMLGDLTMDVVGTASFGCGLPPESLSLRIDLLQAIEVQLPEGASESNCVMYVPMPDCTPCGRELIVHLLYYAYPNTQ